MADSLETQLLVLGGGPGGYAAAFLAADRGMQVTLVDAAPRIGGACLHVGCIPSKILLHAASLLSGAEEAVSFGLKFARPEIDLNVLRGKKDKIVDALSGHLMELARRRQVTLVTGQGTLTDGQTLQVENGPRIRFQNCILATGSSSVRLPAFDIGSPRVLDSSSALKLDDVPASLLIVGGGYIGLELGTVYAALGSKVTVVELTGSLLPGVDADLVRPLAARLQTRFDKILLNTKVVKVADEKTGIRATFEEAPRGAGGPAVVTQETGEPPVPRFDKVLVAVGRRPNSANLGLDKAGVAVDERGFVKVDNQRRTSKTNIFAIGDLAGNPMLAHKAAHEGKLVVKVLSGEEAIWDPRAIPAVVFTDPEIAWCGLTETEAKQQGREIKSAKFYWAASGRAATLGRSDGVTKLLVDPKTDQLLGVGIVGHGAAELIAEAVVAIEMGAVSKDLALCIHPHPTLSETIGQAAETLHGLATDIYARKRNG
jgi:dihydrolipoamide dehydrogenase